MNFTEIHQQFLTEKIAADAAREEARRAEEAEKQTLLAEAVAVVYRSAAQAYGIDEAELRRFSRAEPDWYYDVLRGVLIVITLPEHAPITGIFPVVVKEDVIEVETPVDPWYIDGYRGPYGGRRREETSLGQALDRAKEQYVAEERNRIAYEREEAEENARYEEQKAQRAAEKAERERLFNAVMADEAGAPLTRLWLLLKNHQEE
jgi:hypothetical protein